MENDAHGKPRYHLADRKFASEKELREAYESYAKLQGFGLNSDDKTINLIIRGLIANEKKHGFRYCPCRVLTGNPEEDRNNVCPCAYHEDEINNLGHCRCNLFVRKS